MLSSFSFRVKLAGDDTVQFTFDYILFPFALCVYVILIAMASIRLPKVQPAWVRPLAAVSLFMMICFAFGGIAERIDGDRGLFDIPQYGFEYYLRMLDLFSFGALTNYYPAVMQDSMVLTNDGSATVMLFNIIMALFGFSLIGRLLFGVFARTKSARTTP